MSEAEKMSAIISSQERQEQQLTKVITLLVGNELDEADKGLIGKVTANATKIAEVEKRVDGHDGKIAEAKSWFVGACFGGGIVGGIGIYKLIELLK